MMFIRKIFTYNLLIFILLFSNSIFANKTENQPLYVNILDLNDNFEQQLLADYNSIENKKLPIALDKIATDDESFCKLYRLCIIDDGQALNTNYNEEYILRLFKTTTINSENIQIDIETNPIYSSKFYTYLYAKIKDTTNNKEREGMLPVLSNKHLKLLKTYPVHKQVFEDGVPVMKAVDRNPEDNIMQLVNMSKCIARQPKLQCNIKNSGILRAFIEKNIAMLEIPDDTLFNTILTDKQHNIYKILDYMYAVTGIVEHLHKQNIVHGDINLANLFTLKGKVVLSGFEHFSCPNDKEIYFGINKCVFNEYYHAPEITEQYTNATTESDIYSLGILFTEILYAFASPFGIEVLENNYDPYCCFQDYKKELVSFNRYPYHVVSKIQNHIFYPVSNFIYSLKDFMGYYFQSQGDHSEIKRKLIEVINLCNQNSPKDRPTATVIKNMLHDITEEAYLTVP